MALQKWFTPVQFTAVQTQLFHERRQGPRESVDEFAQELRKLFSNAYSRSTRGGPEAEALGQSMLSNHFVMGLRPELKTKMIGMEGSFEELLMKSRFEEAKNREVAAVKTSSGHPQSGWGKKPEGPTVDEKRKPLRKLNGKKGTTTAALGETSPTTGPKFGKKRCFNCGMEGHMARVCTYTRQTRGDHEARGHRNTGTGTVTAIHGEKPLNERIEDLQKGLHALEVAGAVEQTSGTMSTVEAEEECEASGARLGPAVFATVGVNGVETKALVDTGSPSTVVSLDFVMTVLVKQRKREVTPAQWREEQQSREKKRREESQRREEQQSREEKRREESQRREEQQSREEKRREEKSPREEQQSREEKRREEEKRNAEKRRVPEKSSREEQQREQSREPRRAKKHAAGPTSQAKGNPAEEGQNQK